ncbi:MAG: glycosyltransferase family 2 protein [Acidobacteriota bacterium]
MTDNASSPCTPDISILLPVGGTRACLADFLASIEAAAAGRHVELLCLVRNTDPTVLAQAPCQTRVFQEDRIFPERPSWGAMINVLLDKARGRYFMYASDDIVLMPGSLDAAARAMEASGAAGAAMAYLNMGQEGAHGRFGIDLTLGNKVLVNYGLLDTQACRRLGGFSTDYRFYCADGDMCLRLYEAGLAIVPVFEARVEHHHRVDEVKAANHAVAERDIALYRQRFTPRFHDITTVPRLFAPGEDAC